MNNKIVTEDLSYINSSISGIKSKFENWSIKVERLTQTW